MHKIIKFNVEDVENFVEENLKCKLSVGQRIALQALMRGEILVLPVGSGKTFLYNAYRDFLEYAGHLEFQDNFDDELLANPHMTRLAFKHALQENESNKKD